ncbi:hypothetical protein MUCCIDRAFT_76257 [Mucor lusitanicus CBS 277.49]|uniref:Endopeptidase S2P n=1 Tax=Mucor lusitanicus CBS 277.49 TaxID=747725 RepID=A0A168Q8K7_MUCCL|nr:hypothetical protein MUCCIDRAFT_76257 [Mucor lusitanicus CBS 277.49]
MELFSILWQFLLLWICLYIIVFVLQIISTRKKKEPVRRRPNSLLPTFSIVDDNSKEPQQRDQWEIKLFQVKYTTQRLNNLFGKLTRLSPSFWNMWFTCGVIAASILIFVGMVVILFAAVKILASAKQIIMPSQPINSSNLRKRGIEGVDEDDQVFLPMIPGVTLPMSHIGYYLLALTVCGLFHEAGHAIASYSQGVPIQSSGMFIAYLYPGAFVNIPDQQLQSLNPFKQLRIICAGVWHNLVLYAFSFISLAGGLKLLLLILGWQSLEGYGGVSVVHIRENSPLAPHFPQSTIIYQLDDFPLVNNIEDWNAHLFQEDGRNKVNQGFCTAVPTEDYGSSCCNINDAYPFGQSDNASISCFHPFPNTGKKSDRVCLPTLPVIASTNPQRCYKASDCSSSSGLEMSCVTPYTPSVTGQVVRIYARFPSWIKTENEGNEKVFVFEGELVDIWESVKVSLLTPRFWFLPSSLPHILELTLRYISSFTLALAMLNILPAFKLDGEFALEQFLILLLQPQDATQVTTRSNETFRSTRKIHDTIVRITSVVVGFVIVGSIIVGLLSSKL